MRKVIIYGVLAGALLLLLWGLRSCKDKKIDEQIKSPVLTPSENAKVIVDPRHHTVTTIKREANGHTTIRATFLPPSGASVSVGKDDSVIVTSRSWGTEITPFVGFAFGSDIRLRAVAGVNLFYVHEWELGLGIAGGGSARDVRSVAHVSYNPYGSMFISLGVDNKQTAHVMAGLKF